METDMALPPGLGIRLTLDEYEDRFMTLHKQLYASTGFAFEYVCELVYSPSPGRHHSDHSIVHDGTQWHDFYDSGDARGIEAYHQATYEGRTVGLSADMFTALGHAVGPTLFDLEFAGEIAFGSQGEFDSVSRNTVGVFRCGRRWGLLYQVTGPMTRQIAVAWSDDLMHWEQDTDNPIFGAADWARTETMGAKDAFVLEVDGVYLIYSIMTDRRDFGTIALTSTTDWKHFTDEGPIWHVAISLRGTMGIESPFVFERDGMWHMLFTQGEGSHHAISRSPTFFDAELSQSRHIVSSVRSSYCLGMFHAPEMFEHDGQWWMTTDRKEEARRQNREAGRLVFRGTYGDEKPLEEGLWLTHVRWEGDQPILEKPIRP